MRRTRLTVMVKRCLPVEKGGATLSLPGMPLHFSQRARLTKIERLGAVS